MNKKYYVYDIEYGIIEVENLEGNIYGFAKNKHEHEVVGGFFEKSNCLGEKTLFDTKEECFLKNKEQIAKDLEKLKSMIDRNSNLLNNYYKDE